MSIPNIDKLNQGVKSKFNFRVLFVPATLLLAFGLLFGSCNYQKKDEHLPIKEMQNILLDVSIAESYSSMLRDSVYKMGVKNPDSLSTYYRNIFAHYNITQEQFHSSLAWYKRHPNEMDSLFTAMIPTITRWQEATAK